MPLDFDNYVPRNPETDRLVAHFRRLNEREDRARADGKAEGKADGLAMSVLAVVRARGLAVSATAREAIASCRDLGRLERWVVRAATVASVEELLAE